MKKPKPSEGNEPEQYQLFDTPEYSYRAFVTHMKDPVELLVWFYNQRAGAENLIKEANNDAGLAAHPSGRWTMNCNHFQLAMLAYNLNCWLMLFNREDGAKVETLKHTTLATARLRFLFLAAKIWRHAGRVGVSYSDHYAEQGIFRRRMDRLRSIAPDGPRFGPVSDRIKCGERPFACIIQVSANFSTGIIVMSVHSAIGISNAEGVCGLCSRTEGRSTSPTGVSSGEADRGQHVRDPRRGPY